MNRNQIINLTVLLALIAIIVIIVYINKKIKHKMYDSIENQLNTPKASEDLIKSAYNYETGKYFFETNKGDGSKLEYSVFKTLYRYGGKVLSSLYANGNNSNTNESDIVFVHNTGIYVIECKDTDAISIVGNEDSKNWNYIFNENYSEERYNPLKQNLGHINSLKNVLDNKYSNDCYISIVVINCKNINVTYTSNNGNYNQCIITPEKLESHVISLIKDRERILTDEEVIDIYKYLHENCSNVNKEIKDKHIINIKNTIKDNLL